MRTTIILLLSLMILIGCGWDPPRDNPLDPNHYRYRPIEDNGSLAVQVLTLSQQPVEDAIVELTEAGLILRTDQDGWARFEEVAIGDWWVHAFKQADEGPVYARDSIQVEIRQSTHIETNFRLDAQPYFTNTVVNAVAYQEVNRGTVYYNLYLRANVEDPDGAVDIDSVTWLWNDDISLTGEFEYRLDSSFYGATIPSDSFSTGSIDAALNAPFFFEAFNAAGHSVRSNEVYPARVIHDAPETQDLELKFGPAPGLQWYYILTEFPDLSQFNYLIKIYQIGDAPGQTVYERLIAPTDNSSVYHQLPEPLPVGSYYWYVWVIDLFGNSSRSRLTLLTVKEPIL
ncbi:MAG: hypothetical protein P9M15_05795 [Candidatus Electryoneaceae bacterium]|nr:hypothetical protein [Candidatus Electryoneaceae bacterium]